MRIEPFLCTILLFCSLPVAAFAQELLENGSFEYGINLSCPDDWSCSGSARARGAGRFINIPQLITPHSDDRMVVLAPVGMGDQEIWQEVDFTGFSLATLSFWWRYEAVDWDEEDYGRDALEVWIGNPDDPGWWDRIWESPINVNPSDGQVVSPWILVTISGDVSEIGKLTFRFHLKNAADGGEGNWPEQAAPFTHGQQTVAFLDDASIEASVSITDFLEKLAASVQSLLDSGALNDGQSNSLSAKLDAATHMIEKGNPRAAAGQLGAFVNEVAALERSHRLSSAQRQSLTAPSNAAIDFLSGQ